MQLAAASGAGIADAAWRALGTVRQVMPARLRARIDSVQVVAMAHGDGSEIDPAVLVAVTDATRAHEQLRFDYHPASGPPDPPPSDSAVLVAPRRVEPHHVLHRGGRWYLLAYDLDRADWRTFRIDRMTPRSPTGPRFTPREVPGGDAAEFVAAHFRGSTEPEPGNRWPCQGRVVLHKAATEIAPYLGAAQVKALGPDHCALVMGAWSWAGLAASIAQTDADIDTVEPPELAHAFADLARRALAASVRRPADE